MRRAVALLAALALAPAGAAAQHVGAALSDDTITVGDVAYVAVRVRAPADARVQLPDSLPLTGDLENAGPRRERIDTLADSTKEVTGLYPLTAWRPGSHRLPEVSIVVTTADSVVTRDVSWPLLHVASVLPPDTAGIQPKPPKDVVGPNRAWWPLILLLLLLIGGGLAAWWWWRRRRARAAELPAVTPREAAAAALADAETVLVRGELRTFYLLLTAAARRYLDAADTRWGSGLTTTELVPHLVRDLGEGPARELEPILRRADLVKFARADADPATARDDLTRMRAWISTWPAPLPPPGETPTVEGRAA